MATTATVKSPGRAARGAKATADPMAGAVRTAALLKLVADPTRLAIVGLLAARDHYVGELFEAIGQSQPSVSHHLCQLRLAGVVMARRRGQRSYYGLTEKGLAPAAAVRPLAGG